MVSPLQSVIRQVSRITIGVGCLFLWALVQQASPLHADTPVLTPFDTLPGLFRALAVRDLVFTSDGSQLYAVGNETTFGKSGGIALFHREPTTGALTYRPVLNHAGETLSSAVAVTLSPDERHLYLLNRTQRTVVIYARAADTGTLTRVDEIGMASNIRGLSDLAISPDGEQLYISNDSGPALLVYSRNPTSGTLTFVASYEDGVDGITGTSGGKELSFNQAGTALYMATGSGVAHFTRDRESGALTFVAAQTNSNTGANGLAEAQGLALSPDETTLYVITNELAIVSFTRNLTTGALTWLETIREDGLAAGQLVGCCAVVVAPSGNTVYTAGTYDNQLSRFSRDPANGRLTYQATVVEQTQGVTGLRAARALRFSPDGHDLYVGSHHRFAHFALPAAPPPGAAPIATASDPFPFVASYPAVMWNYVEQAALNTLAVDPNGHFLMATVLREDLSRSELNAVVVLQRDGATGRLTPVEVYEQGSRTVLDFPSAAISSNDGHTLYVSSHFYGLAVFQQRVPTMPLTLLESFNQQEVAGLGGAADLLLSPDNQHLYVAGIKYTAPAIMADAITLFARNPISGQLTFVETITLGGESGNGGADDLAMSADGRTLFALSDDDDAIVTFRRDGATGKLTLLERVQNGVNGLQGLGDPVALALSADEANLYVASRNPNALFTFTHQPVTSGLTYQTQIATPRLYNLAMAPGNDYLYATAPLSHTLLVYTRNQATGALAFHEEHPAPTLPYLDLAVSPDGRNLYTITDKQVVSFATDGAVPAPQAADVTLFYATRNSSVVEPGAAITYTLLVSNVGNALANQVAITVAVPSELDGVSTRQSPSLQPTQQGTQWSWRLPTLAVGAQQRITITGQVSTSVTSEEMVISSAQISATNDLTLTNNQMTAALMLNLPPQLALTLTPTATTGFTQTFALGTINDQGDDGPWLVTVDWGDDTQITEFAVEAAGALPTQQHRYGSVGHFTVVVTVTDRDGGRQQGSFMITITDIIEPPPHFERYLPFVQR